MQIDAIRRNHMITVKEYTDRLVKNISKVIVGKEDVIRQVVICFLAKGHVLLEDLPGTGKTMLLRAFARSIGGDFKRIQFTPDLLPSDLTGINFYNQKEGEFVFELQFFQNLGYILEGIYGDENFYAFLVE